MENTNKKQIVKSTWVKPTVKVYKKEDILGKTSGAGEDESSINSKTGS